MSDRCHWVKDEHGNRHFIPGCWDAVDHCLDPNPMQYCSCPKPPAARMKAMTDWDLRNTHLDLSDELQRLTKEHTAAAKEIARRQRAGTYNPDGTGDE